MSQKNFKSALLSCRVSSWVIYSFDSALWFLSIKQTEIKLRREKIKTKFNENSSFGYILVHPKLILHMWKKGAAQGYAVSQGSCWCGTFWICLCHYGFTNVENVQSWQNDMQWKQNDETTRSVTIEVFKNSMLILSIWKIIFKIHLRSIFLELLSLKSKFSMCGTFFRWFSLRCNVLNWFVNYVFYHLWKWKCNTNSGVAYLC